VVLRERLLDPIGARSLHCQPEQALYYRAAIGHLLDDELANHVAPRPMLQFSNAPAGATPFGAARDLIAVARMHMTEGVGVDDVRVLSKDSVRAMQEEQLSLPEGELADHWGLGWMLFDWGDARVIGHDGGTIGQSASLRVLPAKKLAVAMLMNGGNSLALRTKVQTAIFEGLVDVSLPRLPETTGIAIEAERYVGAYERLAVRIEVSRHDDKLSFVADNRPMDFMPTQEPVEIELVPISETLFEWSPPGSRMRNHMTFLFDDEGRAAYIHLGGRTAPRVA
jgi:CubicO group peptidase (beta-lactamase class C family)